MKLRIRNFAKISKADIEIDGITIIAGNNNTGKSTVGKILDSVFNSSYNIDEKMNKARIDSLASMLRNEIEGSMARVNIKKLYEVGEVWLLCGCEFSVTISVQ